MTLLEIRNNRVFPSIHALLKEPYKSIWEEDLSNNKEQAILYLTYIEFVCSPKMSNPFYGYDERVRPSKVAKEVFKDENFVVPSELILGCAIYMEDLENSSPSYANLRSAENNLNKLKRFLDTMQPDAKTIGGALVLKPKEILLAYKELPAALKLIAEARRNVHEELEAYDIKTRNQRKIGKYEE